MYDLLQSWTKKSQHKQYQRKTNSEENDIPYIADNTQSQVNLPQAPVLKVTVPSSGSCGQVPKILIL